MKAKEKNFGKTFFAVFLSRLNFVLLLNGLSRAAVVFLGLSNKNNVVISRGDVPIKS